MKTSLEGEGLQNNCPDLFKLPSWEVSFLKDSCVIDRKCSYMAISGAQKACSPAVKTFCLQKTANQKKAELKLQVVHIKLDLCYFLSYMCYFTSDSKSEGQRMSCVR